MTVHYNTNKHKTFYPGEEANWHKTFLKHGPQIEKLYILYYKYNEKKKNFEIEKPDIIGNLAPECNTAKHDEK